MGITIHSTKKLNNGNEMPVLGLGTYQMHESAEAGPAVLAALEAGYRLIDTAQMYDNEKAVGEVIKQSGIPREEIFVTTKVYQFDPAHPSAALNVSLDNLGLDYVDLFLIHWPVSGWQKLWTALEEFQRRGSTKNIGVSNFTIDHLEELLALAEVVPQVNQVEFSPFLYQKELLEYCEGNGLALEAYSPLTRGHKLDEPTIAHIAEAHSKTPAQVMIRWSLQHGLVVIPKSSKPRRIAENASVFDFELSATEIQMLDGLNRNNRYCWNPEEAG